MSQPAPSYELRPIRPEQAAELLARHHGYKAGRTARPCTYGFGVYESGRLVACYLWNPPHYQAAKAVCPSAPWGVLALSRMVAVPRSDRQLNHVSKPLRRQMRVLIDRDRWPALVTYSDQGLGHTGHVYKCSGWQPTAVTTTRVYVDDNGARVSRWSNGGGGSRGRLSRRSKLQRWEHHATDAADVGAWMADRGWHRVAIPGRTWASGNPRHTVKYIEPDNLELRQ